MNLSNILKKVERRELSLHEAEEQLKSIFLDSFQVSSLILNFDIERERRTDIPEVIFGKDKTAEQISQIINHVIEKKGKIIVSRVSRDVYAEVKRCLLKNSGKKEYEICYIPEAQVMKVISGDSKVVPDGRKDGPVAIFTAGTSDISVAEECRIFCEEFNIEAYTYYDVGVAAIHRLYKPLKECEKKGVKAGIVIAGLEGALPSVISGLVDFPVIAVPVSAGYGSSLSGFTALFAMLTSCAPGIAVVNINNGFGAAAFVRKMLDKRDG